MLLTPYVDKLLEPLAFWASNCNMQRIPEVVHCNGVLATGEDDCLTFFIAEAFSQAFIDNIKESQDITLLACSVPTFESYQYKGQLLNIRPCTADEIILQQEYVDKFTDIIATIGYSKEAFYNSYYHQPSLAVSFRVTDIFEQTPYKGTGHSMIKK